MKQKYEFTTFDWSRCGEAVFASGKRVLPQPGAFVSSNWHEEIEIKYFRSGTTAVECNSRIYTAVAGDLVVMNPYQAHSFSYLSGEPVYDMLIFPPQLLLREETSDPGGEFLRPFSEHRIRFCCHIPGDTRFGHIFDSLTDTQTHPSPASRLLRHALVLELMAILFSDYIGEVAGEGDAAYGVKYGSLILPAIEYIRRHYKEPIRLEQLAAECGVTVSYFCAAFKRVTGKTAIAFLNAYRAEQASLLLENTNLTTEQIAAATGFPDVSYFYRCFRTHRGMTPRQVREGILKEKAGTKNPTP